MNLIIGAGVGAVVSAGCEIFNQVVIQGKSMNGIDMRKVGISAAGGAISGVLAGTGVGIIGQVAGNSIISAAQNTTNQIMDISDGQQESFDFGSLAIDTTFGAISGKAGGAGNNTNKIIGNAEKTMVNRISKEVKQHGVVDGLTNKNSIKAYKYFGKNIKSSVIKITDGISSSATLTTSQNMLLSAKDKLQDTITGKDE